MKTENNKKDKNKEKEDSHKNFAGKQGHPRNSEELTERQGADEGKTLKKGKSYESDKGESGTQGGYGQGNALNKGEEGAQGYGMYKE